MKSALEKKTDFRDYPGPDGDGWVCDNCGEKINTAGDGWVQWLTVPARSGSRPSVRGLSLVHHVPASPLKDSREHGCQFNYELEFKRDEACPEDFSLDTFCGPDGLMLLLSLLVDAPFSRRGIAEMVMRIHTPGYERARFYFDKATAEGVIEPNLPKGFHWQRDIRAVLRWAKHQKD
jgi:hypothetical protein